MQTLTSLLKQQTEITLSNLSAAIEQCDLGNTTDGIENSRFLFHTIASLDRWFINPCEYTTPYEINLTAANLYTPNDDEPITREFLRDYFTKTSEKTISYLIALSDEKLSEKPPHCDYTRLELIIGQTRHIMCHVGIIMGADLKANGTCPDYMGLDSKY